IDVRIVDAAGNAMDVRGESIGGGAAVIRKIDDIDVRITGESASIVVRQRDEKGVLAHIAQSISDEGVNIATTRMYRERKGDTAYTVLETDQAVGAEAKAAIEDHPAIYDVRIIPGDARADVERVAVPDVAAALQRFAELDFGNGASAAGVLRGARRDAVGGVPRAREAALAASLGYADGAAAYLREALAVMGAPPGAPSTRRCPRWAASSAAKARKLADLHERGGELCDDQLSCAIAYAMAVLETNASMAHRGRAHAGSAGVLPRRAAGYAAHARLRRRRPRARPGRRSRHRLPHHAQRHGVGE
ncbi:MAG: ACT domain-containing protein, partial [Eggerthella lenta]